MHKTTRMVYHTPNMKQQYTVVTANLDMELQVRIQGECTDNNHFLVRSAIF